MKCKNPHCQRQRFIAVVEEGSILIGIKCATCGARYTMDEIEVIKSLKRDAWNSMNWRLDF